MLTEAADEYCRESTVAEGAGSKRERPFLAAPRTLESDSSGMRLYTRNPLSIGIKHFAHDNYVP